MGVPRDPPLSLPDRSRALRTRQLAITERDGHYAITVTARGQSSDVATSGTRATLEALLVAMTRDLPP